MTPQDVATLNNKELYRRSPSTRVSLITPGPNVQLSNLYLVNQPGDTLGSLKHQKAVLTIGPNDYNRLWNMISQWVQRTACLNSR